MKNLEHGQEKCDLCNGKGYLLDKKKKKWKCPKCKAKGTLYWIDEITMQKE